MVGGRHGGLFVFGGKMTRLLTLGGTNISLEFGTGSVTPFVVSQILSVVSLETLPQQWHAGMVFQLSGIQNMSKTSFPD